MDNNDDIDFSIIVPDSEKPKLDFSVNELLENPKEKSNSEKEIVEKSQQQVPAPDGSFMRDLQKMQQQLSYQTNPYDIYQPSEQPIQFTGTVQAKIQETCTKTTNNLTKICQKSIDIDFKHLIIDFSDQNNIKYKGKQSYDDYFEGQILKTKKIDQKQNQKILNNKSKQHKYKTDKFINLHNKYGPIISLKQQNSKEKSSKIYQKSKLSLSTSKSTSQSKQKQNYVYTQKSKSKSKQKCRQRLSINIKGQMKQMKTKQNCGSRRFQSQIYSQYFGFQAEGQQRQKQSQNRKSSKSSKKSKFSSSKSKKKIIFSNKNVNINA